jgi:hypothetical protein
VADDRQAAGGVDHLEIGLEDQQEQDHERHHDEPVRRADHTPLEHPGVAQRLHQHRAGPLALVGEARRIGPALPDHRGHLHDRAHRENDGDEGDGAGQDGGDDLHGAHVVVPPRSADSPTHVTHE